MIYSTTGHGSQRTRDQTETKDENTHSLKTKPEISTENSNHSKLRRLNIRVRTTQWITPRICHCLSPVILLQQDLNFPAQLKHKTMPKNQLYADDRCCWMFFYPSPTLKQNSVVILHFWLLWFLIFWTTSQLHSQPWSKSKSKIYKTEKRKKSRFKR